MFKNENESCHVIELAEIQFKIVYGAMTTAGNEYLSIYSNCTPKQYTHCKMVALQEIKLIWFNYGSLLMAGTLSVHFVCNMIMVSAWALSCMIGDR